jgi:hypothetical protein
MGQIPLIEPKEEVSEKTGQRKRKRRGRGQSAGEKKKQGNDFFSFLVSATESLCLTVNYLLY